MTAIIRLALVAILSGFAATAQAAPFARAIDGASVELSADRATTVVFWSMDCTSCVETMTRLEQASIPYVAVNTDGAGVTSQLRAFARIHNVSAPIVADRDGSIQRQLLAQPEQLIAITATGTISSLDADTLLSTSATVAAK
jgi:hypothetical protein